MWQSVSLEYLLDDDGYKTVQKRKFTMQVNISGLHPLPVPFCEPFLGVLDCRFICFRCSLCHFKTVLACYSQSVKAQEKYKRDMRLLHLLSIIDKLARNCTMVWAAAVQMGMVFVCLLLFCKQSIYSEYIKIEICSNNNECIKWPGVHLEDDEGQE